MKNDSHKNQCSWKKIALEVIKPKRDIPSSRTQCVISVILGIVVAIIVSFSEQTVSIYREILELMNDVFIAFIAMEMGAYALFQALLKEALIYELYKSNDLLKRSNSEFLGLILLFWFCIMLNIIMIIIFKIVPDTFELFQNRALNDFLWFLWLGIYLSWHLRILFEVRNFAINLYKVFEAHNKISLLEYWNKTEKENNE